MSGYALVMTFEVTGGDPEFADRYAERATDLRPFLDQAGVYMLRLQAGSENFFRKVALVK